MFLKVIVASLDDLILEDDSPIFLGNEFSYKLLDYEQR